MQPPDLMDPLAKTPYFSPKEKSPNGPLNTFSFDYLIKLKNNENSTNDILVHLLCQAVNSEGLKTDQDVLRGPLIRAEMIELMVKMYYPELDPLFLSQIPLEISKSDLFKTSASREHFFNVLMEELLVFPLNPTILSTPYLVSLLLQASLLESSPRIKPLLFKLLHSVLSSAPTASSLSTLLSFLSQGHHLGLKLLSGLLTHAPNPSQSLVFHQFSSISVESIASGMRNADNGFSFCFEIRLLMRKNTDFLEFSARNHLFRLGFVKETIGFTLRTALLAENYQENHAFSAVFPENTWFSVVFTVERGVFRLLSGSKAESLKFSQKGHFKAFEKGYSLSIGAWEARGNQGFIGELKAFSLIDKGVRGLEELENLKTGDISLEIGRLASVCNRITPVHRKRKLFNRKNEVKKRAEMKKKDKKLGFFDSLLKKVENPGRKAFLPLKIRQKNVYFMEINPEKVPCLAVSMQMASKMASIFNEKGSYVQNTEDIGFMAGLLAVIRKITLKGPEKAVLGAVVPVCMRKVAKRAGFSKDLLENYFAFGENMIENRNFELFPRFFLDFGLFLGQSFEIRSFFLQKLKLELERQPELLAFVRENKDSMLEILAGFEALSTEKTRVHELEFETYRDFFCDILFVIFKHNCDCLQILTGAISSENTHFWPEYVDLLHRIYCTKGNSLLPTNNLSKTQPLTPSISLEKPKDSMQTCSISWEAEIIENFRDLSQGNLIILDRGSVLNPSVLKQAPEQRKPTENSQKSLDFEDFLLTVAISRKSNDTLDFFLQVFLDNREKQSREGSLKQLLERSEADIAKIRLVGKMETPFGRDLIERLVGLLGKGIRLGLSLEDALLEVIVRKIGGREEMRSLEVALGEFPDLRLFFFGSVKRTTLLCTLIWKITKNWEFYEENGEFHEKNDDFSEKKEGFSGKKGEFSYKKEDFSLKKGDFSEKKEAFSGKKGEKKGEQEENGMAFLIETLALGLESMDIPHDCLETLLGYDKIRLLPKIRDALGEILASKHARNEVFQGNLTEIVRILCRIGWENQGIYEITEKTYIFAWRLFAEIEFFHYEVKKTAFCGYFVDLVCGVLWNARKQGDFMQGMQIMKKVVREFPGIVRKTLEIKTKLAVFHAFLVTKPENQPLLKGNPEIRRFLIQGLMETIRETFNDEEIRELCGEQWVFVGVDDSEERAFLSSLEANNEKLLQVISERMKDLMKNIKKTLPNPNSPSKPNSEHKNPCSRTVKLMIELQKQAKKLQADYTSDMEEFQVRKCRRERALIHKHYHIIRRITRSPVLTPTAEDRQPIYKTLKFTDPLSRRLFISTVKDSKRQRFYLSAQKYQEMQAKTPDKLLEIQAKSPDFLDMPDSFTPKSTPFRLSGIRIEELSEISRKNENLLKDSRLLFVKKSGGELLNSASSPARSLFGSEGNLMETVDPGIFKFQSQPLIRAESCRSPAKKAMCSNPNVASMGNISINVGKIKETKKTQFLARKSSEYPSEISKKETICETLGIEKKGFFAEKLTVRGSLWGVLHFSSSGIRFKAVNQERPSEKPYIFGAMEESLLRFENYEKEFLFSKITSIFPRNFNSITNSFELFLQNGKTYFFIVYSVSALRKVFTLISHLNPNKHLHLVTDLSKAFKKARFTDQWLNNEISNYEYLMRLNEYSNRSFNDLNQYPVFPWTFVDFSETAPDFSNPKLFRDLSKPIGAIDATRLSHLRSRMKELMNERIPESERMKPFLYGSHYSGSGNVMYFLIRMEPITSLSVGLQSGKFDVPDRLFLDVAETWRSCLCFHSDFKELIPEFYSNPEFLRNRSNFEFGRTQMGVEVSDVGLPKWARSPEEFVFRNRQALESRVVSRALASWIDLIFGCKQRGEAAMKADNLFYYMTYEGEVDLEKINDENELKAVLMQLASYGQAPKQLFHSKKHPERAVFKEENLVLLQQDVMSVDFGNVWTFPNEISALQVSDNGIRIILRDFAMYFLPFKHQTMTLLPWAIWDTSNLKKKPHAMDFEPELQNNYEYDVPVVYLFKNESLGNMMIVAGFSDKSFRFVRENHQISNNFGYDFHKKPISCITASEKLSLVFCGSQDCLISVWEFSSFESPALKCSPITNPKRNVFFGHGDEILMMEYNEDTGLLLSIDQEGVCLLFSLRLRRLMRRLQTEGERFFTGSIHGYGVVALFSKGLNVLFNVNGDIIAAKNMQKNQGLRQVGWIGKNSSEIAMAFENGEIEVCDVFGFECRRVYNLPFLGEKKKIKLFAVYDTLGEVFIALKGGQLISMRKSEFSRQAQKNEFVDVLISEIGIE